MKTKLIPIGNSQGVRIPKPFIEGSGITGEIEMILRENEIILRAAQSTRKGWDDSFKRMAEQQDDSLLDEEVIHKAADWDDEEWTW